MSGQTQDSTESKKDKDSTKNKGDATKVGFRMNLKKKSSKKTSKSSDFFDAPSSHNEPDEERVSVQDFAAEQKKEPLVIPVVPNRNLVLARQQEGASQSVTTAEESRPSPKKTDEDQEAIRALQAQASSVAASQSTSSANNGKKSSVIAAQSDTFQRDNNNQRETQQFQNDLQNLPDEMNVEDYTTSRVKIADFGAAMLRGMGWKGDNDDHDSNNKRNNNSGDAPSLPRPHRLGLGATPKLEENMDRKRPRTMDQYDRDRKRQAQAREFDQERQRQRAADKQQTLQIGSLLHLRFNDRRSQGSTTRRAKVVQLQGVPGLNQVLVQLEGEAQSTSVGKGSLGDLVTRAELQDRPFQLVDLEKKKKDGSDYHGRGVEPISSYGKDDRKRSRDDRRYKEEHDQQSRSSGRRGSEDDVYYDRKRSRDRDDHKRRRREEESSSSKDRRHRRQEESSSSRRTWVIPQIRVRIITEKLGRRYFKEKGTVVDVTSKGSTIQLMQHSAVLDRVPERYLETALPKAGGKVVILTRPSSSSDTYEQFDKGTLLERSKGRGIVQLSSDQSVVTLSLDDLAEWVGSVDDDY